MQLSTRYLLVLFTFTLLTLTLASPAPGPYPQDPNLFKPLPPKPSKTATTPKPTPTGKCNTGPIQCCQKVTTVKDPVAGLIISLLGIVIKDLTTVVGMTCSPLSIIGIGGSSCIAQPVCCENNNFNGLIAIGCSPISL